jgi:hypothetical protein
LLDSAAAKQSGIDSGELLSVASNDMSMELEQG